MSNPILNCPVCSAKFRGQSLCSRCGTDLTALMQIAARAWAARRRCRQELLAGNLAGAMRWSVAARRLHDKAKG